MWALIDNYDSFTYILHDYLLQTGRECRVFRNDAVTVSELDRMGITRLIISPGPETPLQAGISMEAIEYFQERIPILGICLGHQAIGMLFGGQLLHNPEPVHGKTSAVVHQGHPVFNNISNPFPVMRYHSLCIKMDEESELQSIAQTAEDGMLMALAHRRLKMIGLQFHPESIGTPDGLQMLKNWAGLWTETAATPL